MLSHALNQPFLGFLRYLDHKREARLLHVQLGVWDVFIRERPKSWLPALPTKGHLKECISDVSVIWRFVREIHSLAPRQFWVYAANSLWVPLETLLSGYVTGLVTDVVLGHLYDRNQDTSRILSAVAYRICLVVVRHVVEKLVFREEQIIRSRITHHFLQKSIAASLRHEHDHQPTGSKDYFYSRSYFDCDALAAFEGLFAMVSSYTKMVSQLGYTYTILRQHRLDPIFISVNVVQSFLLFSSGGRLWSEEYFSCCSNRPFKRMCALYKLTQGDVFSADIKSDGLGDYLIKELGRCKEEIGDAAMEDVHDQWNARRPLSSAIFDQLIEMGPSMYYAVRLIFYPNSMTPSSYAKLQNAANAISSSVYIVWYEQRLQRIPDIREIYREEEEDLAFLARENQLIPYPQNEEKSQPMGMEIEFRNVSFSYPNSTKNALDNVSFTIKRGQLVAIVGVNGSGKSSITNLFNRLYDPTEGEIFVDGLPIRSYRRADIRRAMAILRQKHPLYPLSLRENISLGLPDKPCTDDDLEAAIKCGGASEFIAKLPDKLDTELAPESTISNAINDIDEDPILAPLKAMIESESAKDVSGGESQRLAASRTFLRLRGGNIRFLAADEPTSALDPEGEFELFTRLKQHRGDMTLVFVTHRFGHVTRYADLILCMKDGYLVEQGTHQQLMEKGEEYYKLYSVQAQAFTSEMLKDDEIMGNGVAH